MGTVPHSSQVSAPRERALGAMIEPFAEQVIRHTDSTLKAKLDASA